jgi:histidinol phosphatase-like enzyme
MADKTEWRDKAINEFEQISDKKIYISDRIAILDRLENGGTRLREHFIKGKLSIEEWRKDFANAFSNEKLRDSGIKLMEEFAELGLKDTKNRLIVFDKDGTLTKTKSGKAFSQSPDDQKLIFKESDFSHLGAIGIATNQKGISLGYKTTDFLRKEIHYLRRKLNFWFEFCLACPDDGQDLIIFDPSILMIASGIDREIDNNSKFLFPYFVRNEKQEEEKPNVFGLSTDLTGTYRKPCPGMLKAIEQIFIDGVELGTAEIPDFPLAVEEKIYVGNAETDFQAAMAAGFEYCDFRAWAELTNG